MGCSCFDPVKEDPIVRLNKLRSQVMSTIEINKIKISKLEQDIQNFDAQIKQGENDIKQNQYSYSDLEKKAKVKKLMEYQKDRQRAQETLGTRSPGWHGSRHLRLHTLHRHRRLLQPPLLVA